MESKANLGMCICGLHGVLYDSEGRIGCGVFSKENARWILQVGIASNRISAEDVTLLDNLIEASSLPDRDADLPFERQYAFSRWHRDFNTRQLPWKKDPCALEPYLKSIARARSALLN